MVTRFARGFLPALALAALPAISSAGIFVGVSVNIAPPALPVYVQPPCPEAGYLWVPGYWAWNDGAYYWVPGTWVLPPEVGLLWTPGYWGWDDGAYFWHAGYWGPHVGFYGGVHYGFGYDGDGYDGGYWRGSQFYYNRAVVRVGPTFVHNVYYHQVVYRTTYEHVSFNGGPGGVRAEPSREQRVAEHEHHEAFTSVQQRQQRMAFADHSLRADFNHGRPPVAATARPAVFHGTGAFAARAAGGPVHFTPAHTAAPMRSDRPSWASGQNHAASRSMEQQHFQSRPQGNSFEARPNRPMERPQERYQARPQTQPEFRQNFRPEQSSRPPENFRSQQNFRPEQSSRPQENFRPQQNFRPEQNARPQENFRPQQNFRPEQRGPEPRPQQRGGGERPQHPPENRGHNR